MMEDIMTDPDGEMIDIDLIVTWLKDIKMATDEVDKNTVYPDAIGFLMVAKKEYMEKSR
ncbi:hypothetical protein LCGC14_3051770 [marine sediment metagenome]|uniref:Uncharacterized protein n=1 Tax=marine sediment metagenome TaxID=412755 RepID=A0A0F8WLX4_9ZZZZ